MKLHDRVKHPKYGVGTIIYVMFENTKREMYLVEFDVSNSELHDGLGLTKKFSGGFYVKSELEILKGG